MIEKVRYLKPGLQQEDQKINMRLTRRGTIKASRTEPAANKSNREKQEKGYFLHNNPN